MNRLAILGFAIFSWLAASTSASAQWWQSRSAGGYQQPAISAPSYGRTYRGEYRETAPNPGYLRGNSAVTDGWANGGDGSFPPPYYRNLPADYVAAGRRAFRAGQYELALSHWQYALLGSPKDGGIQLFIAQACFALGKYQAAATALQTGLQILPQNEWGHVVKDYSHLYANVQHYKDQLKALEDARNAKPDDPAMRLVLGYQFGYLGHPKHAVAELDKALELQPKESPSPAMGPQKLVARELRDLFATQAGLPARPSFDH